MKKMCCFLLIFCVFLSFLPFFSVKNVFAYSFSNDITLSYNGKNWMFNVSGEISNFEIQYQKQKRQRHIASVGFSKYVSMMKSLNLSSEEILNRLFKDNAEVYNEMVRNIEKEPIEPSIKFNSFKDEMWEISEGQSGVKINKELLLQMLSSAGNEHFKVPIIKVEPHFNKNDLLKNTFRRSEQNTSYSGSEAGRRFNLIKAVNCFNNLVVMPNEVVSFNDIIDRRDNGEPYREAIIILDGEFTRGIGGGICQASTTVYNAVLMAGLEIQEVHRHTLPVGYVERGFDAMVNDGGSDMVFKNNTNYPIYFKTYTRDEKVFVRIYGEDLHGVIYEKESVIIKELEPEKTKPIPDVDGKYSNFINYKGEFHTIKYAKKGYVVEGYLKTYKNGELVNRTLVRKERYLSSPSVIYEGTKERKEEEKEENTVDN